MMLTFAHRRVCVFHLNYSCNRTEVRQDVWWVSCSFSQVRLEPGSPRKDLGGDRLSFNVLIHRRSWRVVSWQLRSAMCVWGLGKLPLAPLSSHWPLNLPSHTFRPIPSLHSAAGNTYLFETPIRSKYCFCIFSANIQNLHFILHNIGFCKTAWRPKHNV